MLNRVAAFSIMMWLLLGANPVFAAWHSKQWPVMGTQVSAEIWHEDASSAEIILQEIQAEMLRIEQWLSPYIESSELSRVNQQAFKTPVSISSSFYALIEKSLYYSKLSEGAFDISFASLAQYYNYRDSKKPDEKLIKETISSIGYRHIHLSDQPKGVRFLEPGMKIDLGGIAKGYAVDRCIDILKNHQVLSGIVSAGGDSRVLGQRGHDDSNPRPWYVAVKHPRNSAEQVAILPLQNEAISTSGDYERFFIDPKSQQRVHHILNPKTGVSSRGVTSATVVGPNGADTDALSTSIFVLGVRKGLALINRLPAFEAVIIDEAGALHYSSGLLRAAKP